MLYVHEDICPIIKCESITSVHHSSLPKPFVFSLSFTPLYICPSSPVFSFSILPLHLSLLAGKAYYLIHLHLTSVQLSLCRTSLASLWSATLPCVKKYKTQYNAVIEFEYVEYEPTYSGLSKALQVWSGKLQWRHYSYSSAGLKNGLEWKNGLWNRPELK